MSNKNTRRDILKLAGTTAAIGFAGQATARTGSNASESEVLPENHALSYDLNIQNNSQQAVALSIEFYQTTEDGKKADESPVFTKAYQLRSHTKASDATRTSLDIPGGVYIVDAQLGNGPTASTVWGVPPGGVPEWMGLSIHILPWKSIKFYREEL